MTLQGHISVMNALTTDDGEVARKIHHKNSRGLANPPESAYNKDIHKQRRCFYG